MRPDLVVVISDQQRADTISALGGWCGPTPAFDRISAEGTVFVQATTPCPVCAPARCSLYSGLYPRDHGWRSNHHHGPRPEDHLFSRLRAAGYRTALVGKNHSFVTPADVDILDEHPEPSDREAVAQRRAWRRQALASEPRLPVSIAPGAAAGDPDRGRTETALRLLNDDDPRPLALVVSWLLPHTPYEICEPFASQPCDPPPPRVEPEGLEAAGKPWRQCFHRDNERAVLGDQMPRWRELRRAYAARVRQLDAELGQLLDAIDRRRRPTLLAVCSDHGDYLGDHGLFAKSPALYDCLVRVPLLLRWPGMIPAGRRDLHLASLVDLLPTLCAAAGIAPPPGLPGVDLVAAVRDPTAAPLRSCALAEYGLPGPPWDARLPTGVQRNPGVPGLPWEGNPVALAGPIRMARTAAWKWIREPGGRDEVYDLVSDPHELINRADHDRPTVPDDIAAWLETQL